MPAPSDNERRRVLYSGRVQGVGFRFTAANAAQSHAVTGFVKNLPNGKVELVVEGSAAELDSFLGEVAAAMAAYIDDASVEKLAATGQYSSFQIAP